MLGEPVLAAPRRFRMGLVESRYARRCVVFAKSTELAAKLAQGPSFALGMTKTMLDMEANLSLPQAWKPKRRHSKSAWEPSIFAKPMPRSSPSVRPSLLESKDT